MTHDEMKTIIGNCKYLDWIFELRLDNERPYLQIRCKNGIDVVTGGPLEWTSRKWMLSYFMVPNEVVTTAWKAVESAIIHEAKEFFTYKNVDIFNPHIDPDKLVDFVSNRANIQERQNVEFSAP